MPTAISGVGAIFLAMSFRVVIPSHDGMSVEVFALVPIKTKTPNIKVRAISIRFLFVEIEGIQQFLEVFWAIRYFRLFEGFLDFTKLFELFEPLHITLYPDA